MAYVLKVKYENSLRRITLRRSDISDNQQNVSFALLEGRIRDVFQFPSTAQLVVTYTDEEDDLVTMASDQDVVDALILQALNPLRLHVTLLSPSKSPAPTPPSEVDQGSSSERNEADATLNRVRVGLAAAPESVKQLLQPYERLFDGVTNPAQIPGVVENLIQTFATQFSSAVKMGAAAASAAGTAAVSAATTAAVPATPSAAPAPVQTEPFATSHRRSYADILRPEGKEARSARALGNDALFQAHQAMPLNRIPNFYPNVHRWNEAHLSKPAVHAGITCDVCGAFPIMGTRWKSTKKNDYDLCSVCFEREGDAADYVKMEKAAYPPQFPDLDQRSSGQIPHSMAHHPIYAPQFYGGRPHGMRGPGPYGPFGPGGRHHCGGGPVTGKLMDARFVCDVTMVDGTEVSSGLPFTKIWRLRNSGVYPWPAVTSLEHVGGDEMGQASRVLLLEIPHQGLAPGEEMHVAVDLVAPQKPGSYVSYWRLALPVGHRFGNRLSVRIQVMQTQSIPETESAAGSSSDATLASATEEIASTQLPTVLVTGDVTPVNEMPVLETEASGSTAEVESDSNSVDNAEQQNNSTTNFDLGEEFSIVYAADAVTSLAEDAIRDYEVSKRAAEEAISAARESTEAKRATEEAMAASREYVEATIAAQEAIASLSAQLSNTDEQARFADHVELAEKTDLEYARELVRNPVVKEERISYPTLDVVRDAGVVTYPTIPNITEPVSPPPKVEESASSSSPIVDTTTYPELYENAELNPSTFDSMFYDNAEAVRAVQAAEEDDVPASKALLAKLDAMGFSDSKLNLELLEKNNMDLRRTLDDLCTADEWEPFLAELEEMGFHDVAVNRRLMFKNNGSVKRVVKDLVQMYRDAQGKTVKVE